MKVDWGLFGMLVCVLVLVVGGGGLAGALWWNFGPIAGFATIFVVGIVGAFGAAFLEG